MSAYRLVVAMAMSWTRRTLIPSGVRHPANRCGAQAPESFPLHFHPTASTPDAF